MNYLAKSFKVIVNGVIIYCLFKKIIFSVHLDNNNLLNNSKANEHNIYKYTLIFGLNFLKDVEDLQDSIVLVNSPFSNNLYLRYVAGIEGNWIKNNKTNIFSRVPSNHVWLDSFDNFKDNNTSFFDWENIPIYIINSKVVLALTFYNNRFRILRSNHFKDIYNKYYYKKDNYLKTVDFNEFKI